MSKGIEKAAEFGNTLVDLAKEVGGEAFPMMVEHTKMSAAAWLIISSVVLTIAVAGVIISLVCLYKGEGEEWGPVVVVSLIVLVFALFIGASDLPDYLAPEGATVKQILRSIG